MKGSGVTTQDLETPLPAADDRIGFHSVFHSPSLEDAFRRRHLDDDIGLARACLLVAVVGGVIFTLIDYRLFGLSGQFYVLVGVRLLSFAVALLIWRGLRRCSTPAAFDRLVLLMCLFGAMMSLYVNLTRPPGHIGHAIGNVMLVGLTYCVIPMSLLRQTLLVGLFSAAYVACMADHPIANAGLTTTTMIGATFAVANALGIVTSWRLNHRRRLAFVAMLRETELRVRLEQALAEVRTLRGYLSICAWCKRVRDDKQGWQNLEAFVQARTHAHFTHSICPVCFEKHFGEEEEAASSQARR